jgi:uncharacterized membrane protein
MGEDMRNANKVHRDQLTINERIATSITQKIGSMWAAYTFGALTLLSLPAVLLSGDTVVIVAWVTQTFLQLVLLPIIMVGQNLQSRHSETRAELQYEMEMRMAKETEEIMKKLDTLIERVRRPEDRSSA